MDRNLTYRSFRSLARLTALLLLLASFPSRPLAAAAAAPDPALPAPLRYGVEFWTESQGLSQSRIRAIIQTRDGYLWLGTVGGLIRFDGLTFTTFDTRTGSLKDNEISSLLEDAEGRLWIGTTSGLTLYENGHFRTYQTADGLPDDMVRRLDLDPDGNVWIGTSRGLCRYSHDTFTTFTAKDGLSSDFVTAICASSRQGVFVGAGNRLHRFVNGKFVVVEGLVGEQDGRLDCIAATSDGSLWISFENAVIKKVVDGKLATTYTKAQNLSTRTSVIYEDPQGIIWVGSRDGLRRLRDGRFEPVTINDTQKTIGVVLCLFTDREGSLWVGMESDGLARLRNTPITMLTTQDGLPDNSTRTLFKDSRGNVWIGTTNGFARYAEGRITSYTQMNETPIPTVTSIGEDKNGTLWIGAGGQLLLMKDGKLARDPNLTRVFDIKVIYRDPVGRMWVGTDGDGLYCFEDGRRTIFRTQQGLAGNQIRSILCDRQGTLWVGTSGRGLSHYEGGKFTTFTTREGLGNNSVVAIFEDDAGTLWFGTRGGLTRLKGGRFLTFRSENGLLADYIHGILDDGRGNFWFSSDQGLFRVGKSDFEDFVQGRIKKITSTSLGVHDGMKTTAFGAGTQPNACKSDSGTLLFSSLKGVVEVNPTSILTNTVVPPVTIERVLIDKQPVPTDLFAELPPGQGEVEIHYTALSFLSPEKVQFKYRLEGFDEDWVEAGSRRFAYYANLTPGKYQFRVQACNNDGIWNQDGKDFVFYLRPHFYQARWFYLLGLCSVLLLIGAAYELRVRQLKSRQRELRKKVDEAVARVKVLSGMLPICANCKKIRDDKGYWNNIETYILEHSDTEFSHGICPDCMHKLYPGYGEQSCVDPHQAPGAKP